MRSRRPWTRAGAVAFAAHLGYEVAAGVAVPLASRLGPGPVAAVYAGGVGLAFREAGRRPPDADPAFAVLNGAFLAAVLGHFASWPRSSKAGLPWLTECEGLEGRVIAPYNLILYASFVAALGGLVENRRHLRWGLATPAVLVPLFLKEAPREYERLVAQAQRHPRWWNRRLQGR